MGWSNPAGLVLTCWCLLSVCCLVHCFHDDFADLRGDYCRIRRPQTCCPNRDDNCGVPILGTLCYCDMFCNRTRSADCCPDFWEHCMGIAPPEPIIHPQCFHSGVAYNVGQSIQINCNKCTCRQTDGSQQYGFVCEDRPCLIRPELVQTVNSGEYGWRASNYSFFWGKSLGEGIRYRLGTHVPSKLTLAMTEIHPRDRIQLPDTFDARQRWPGYIHGIVDQGDCGASWAISTVGLASDRLAIHSNGEERDALSAQHLISCQKKRQRGCEGGHLDRAWWYLRMKGVATEQCYPYESGWSGQTGTCRAQRIGDEIICPAPGQGRIKLHYSTPPYRVAPQEETIMQEIYTNGPVQASFRVHEDFFMYRHGVYRRAHQLTDHEPSQNKQHGWHSVRIIGWGVDRSGGRPVKYWLCANSWGRQWGEEGFFRIIRGDNECEVEAFIVGVWGKREDIARHHRHRHRNANPNRRENQFSNRAI